MCPNCRAFITITDRVCPYCEAQLGPRAIDLRATQFVSSLLPRANLMSIVFLTINAAFFVAMAIVSYELSKEAGIGGFSSLILVIFGAKYGLLIHQGQWWRLITAGFLHGGLIHILMNSWALFDLIGEVEQFYGTSRLITAYLFSSFTGFLLSYLWSPNSVSIGASASCFGLIGVMLAMGLRRQSPLSQAVRSYYGRWAVYGLAMSFLPFFHIDIAAHVGGLAGGFLVGLIGGMPGLPNSPRELLWKALAGAAIIVTVYAFIEDYFSFATLIKSI